MHLYRVDVVQPAVLRHVRDLGVVSSYSGMGHLDGGVAELAPGELVVGWVDTLNQYEIATNTLTPLISDPRLEQVCELTWYRGETWITDWFTFNPATNDRGPKILRWNRLNDTLVQELGAELVLNSSNAAQMRPIRRIGSSIDFAGKAQRDAGARRPAVSAVVWTWTTPQVDGRVRAGTESAVQGNIGTKTMGDSPRTGLETFGIPAPYAAGVARVSWDGYAGMDVKGD